MKPTATFHAQVDPSQIERLIPLFGTGVGIVTQSGIALMTMLCDQLGIDRDYVDQRVQTIFVNGRAVDRVDQVSLPADAVVALSAAMPGLVGATFRKQGMLAAFRKDISHVSDAAVQIDRHDTVVTLKLFNLVARELAPELLRRKVWLKGRSLPDLLKALYSGQQVPDGTVVWDHRVLTGQEMARFQWPDGWVALDLEIVDER